MARLQKAQQLLPRARIIHMVGFGAPSRGVLAGALISKLIDYTRRVPRDLAIAGPCQQLGHSAVTKEIEGGEGVLSLVLQT